MERTVQVAAKAFILLALAACAAFAGGYQLNEHGARAVGLGGAFVARADDPSAIYYNPAGLAFQNGFNIMGGATFIFPSTTFTPATPDSIRSTPKQKGQVYFPPNLYATYAMNNRWVFGFGVFTPYGLGSSWDDSWIGSRLSVKSTLQTFYFNPTAAYRFSDQLSVGAGVSLVYATVDMTHRVPTLSGFDTLGRPVASLRDGGVELNATSTAFNYNFGVIYKPIKKLSLGASFRAETKVKFSGTATFTDMQFLTPYFPGGTGTATLPMPMNVQMGASYDVMPDLNVEADFQFVKWSSYKELTIDLPIGPAFGPRPLQGPSTQPKNWDDGYLGRVGAEYKYDEKWTFRGGVIYDISPQPVSKMEPMLPDANRIDASIGVGIKIDEKRSVDFAYMIVLFQKQSTNYAAPGSTPGSVIPFPGTYESTANLFSFDVSYRF